MRVTPLGGFCLVQCCCTSTETVRTVRDGETVQSKWVLFGSKEEGEQTRRTWSTILRISFLVGFKFNIAVRPRGELWLGGFCLVQCCCSNVLINATKNRETTVHKRFRQKKKKKKNVFFGCKKRDGQQKKKEAKKRTDKKDLMYKKC